MSTEDSSAAAEVPASTAMKAIPLRARCICYLVQSDHVKNRAAAAQPLRGLILLHEWTGPDRHGTVPDWTAIFGPDWMRNAITWVDEADIADRLIGQGEVTAEVVRRMGGYLKRKCGERPMASRADIDPTEIREFLPYVVLVDIHDDPLRVYYRLVGTRIAEFYGEFTGTWMHDRPISGAYRQIAEKIYRTLIDTKAPVFGITEMRTRTDALVSYEWGYFPLSSDGVNVTGGLEIESPERRVVGVAPALANTFIRRG